MRQEVLNLDILAKNAAKVPRVLDQNAIQPPETTTPLYLVMEYIEGKTLHDLVKERGRLTWEEAVNVTTALGQVLQQAHELSIIHRDLKPKNIMVRDLAKSDFVLIDFGLSFNHNDPVDLTETEEPIGNRFLRLPEGGPGSEDKRDKRSDTTRLVGVLHYCLTGVVPENLRDHSNRAPHQRPGCSARDILGDNPCVAALELFFDRGFEFRMEDRFQTCEELLERLETVVRGTPPVEDIETLAARLSADLHAKDKKTQLLNLQTACSPLIGLVANHYTGRENRLGLFVVVPFGAFDGQPLPPEYEIVCQCTPLVVMVRGHSFLRRLLCLSVGLKGKECHLLGQLASVEQSGIRFISAWESMMVFSPARLPGIKDMEPHVDARINLAMKQLHAEILGSGQVSR
jgi:serine/threonine protein kinase